MTSNIRLSLEKPYKDANGVPLKTVYDISNEDEFIYEQPKSIDEQLGTRLQRVFEEHGNAIWDEYSPSWANETPDAREATTDEEGEEDETDEEPAEIKKKPMNVEELAKLRAEVIPTLHAALNELIISRDTLGVYLKTAFPSAPSEGVSEELKSLPPNALASTVVTKPPPIPSLQAFNSQLTVGAKDEALRKSAAAFKAASISMRRALSSGKRYWTDALKARNANWALVPAPLPYGEMTRRSADKNAMDVCISYGLEHGTAEHRLSSMVWLNTEEGKGPIALGNRKPTRLCISIVMENEDGTKTIGRSTFLPRLIPKEEEDVEDVLEDLQREAIEKEIWSELVQNAAKLFTAPAWVRQETIMVDISTNTVLKLELAFEADLEPSPLPDSSAVLNGICDAVYRSLHLLLLRINSFNASLRIKVQRGGLVDKSVAVLASHKPPLLQGIVELFQYYLFVIKLDKHLQGVVAGLEESGVGANLRLNPLGETAEELIGVLATSFGSEEQKKRSFGGEALLRIAQQQTLRFLLSAPANLVAYMSHSAVMIHSMTDLDELLKHEVNRCILQRICDIGRLYTHGAAKEAWFSDVVAAKCFTSWDGIVIGFKLYNAEGWRIRCVAEVSMKGKVTERKKFSTSDLNIFDWASTVIKDAVGS